MAKRTRRARRKVGRVARRVKRRVGAFARSRGGFISKEMLKASGGAAAAALALNWIPDHALQNMPSLNSGWGKVAMQAGVGIVGAYFMRRYDPSIALGFGAGAIASAGFTAYQIVKAGQAGGAANAGDDQSNLMGFIDSSGTPVAGFLDGGGNVYSPQGEHLGVAAY